MRVSESLTQLASAYHHLNIPNFLTISRVLAIPFFIVALAYGQNGTALIIFLVCGLTDGLDGFIARTYHQRTAIGAFLDPLADKLLLTSSFVTLTLVDLPNKLPFWLIVTVISRDMIISLGIAVLFMLGTDVKIAPTFVGKLTTFLQITLILIVLLLNYRGIQAPHLLSALYWLTFSVTVISGLGYIFQGIRVLNTTSDSHETS